jgi:hypothetical protein
VFQYIRGYEVWSIGKPEVYDRKTGSRASILGSLLSVSGRFKDPRRSGRGKLFGERELEVTGEYPSHRIV